MERLLENFLESAREQQQKEKKIFHTIRQQIGQQLLLIQGSKKPPSGRPGQADFPFGQVTFSPSLPMGQGPRQAVRRLHF